MEYKVNIYRNGSTRAPGPEMFFLSQWEKEFNLCTYVFIVKGGGHTIMVDTGCGDVSAINQMLFKEFEGKISFDLPENEKIDAILSKSGTDPGEVDYVFLSHLHHDHSSNVDLFPNAKVVLSKKGWLEYMKKERPYYYNDALFPVRPIKYISGLPSEKIIFVEDELEVLPGVKAFQVGGHTPCCMAVQVSTCKGRVVFTSDVAFFEKNVTENHPVGLFYNLWECFEAYKKIRQNADIIITSHEPAVLEKLFTGGDI
jgi:glyoxylase-like metal-dependent hydrolase (beta-lactamase superfamily II)